MKLLAGFAALVALLTVLPAAEAACCALSCGCEPSLPAGCPACTASNPGVRTAALLFPSDSITLSNGSSTELGHFLPDLLDAAVTVRLDHVSVINESAPASCDCVPPPASTDVSPSSLEGSVLTGYWIAYPTGLGACFDYDFLKNLNDLQENLQVQISGLPFCPLTNSRVLAVQGTLLNTTSRFSNRDVPSEVLRGANLTANVAVPGTADANDAVALLVIKDSA